MAHVFKIASFRHSTELQAGMLTTIFNYRTRALKKTGNPILGVRDNSGLKRASAVAKEVFNKWQIQIEAIAKDLSLTPEQRAAAIMALRERQKEEASAARQRILEEERSIARALKQWRIKNKDDQQNAWYGKQTIKSIII